MLYLGHGMSNFKKESCHQGFPFGHQSRTSGRPTHHEASSDCHGKFPPSADSLSWRDLEHEWTDFGESHVLFKGVFLGTACYVLEGFSEDSLVPRAANLSRATSIFDCTFSMLAITLPTFSMASQMTNEIYKCHLFWVVWE